MSSLKEQTNIQNIAECQTYLNYAFGLSRRCLWFLGVWPNPTADFRPRINARFVMVTCILSLYMMIPQLINMMRSWSNVARLVEHVASVNLSIMALSKLIVTWYYGETLRKLVTSVLADWSTAKNKRERDTMLRLAKSGRNLSLRYCVCCGIAVSFYIMINLLRLRKNIALQQQQRRLLYHFVYPYNSQRSPMYEITYLLQISGGMYASLSNCIVDGFVVMLLLHVCAQLINLRIALDDLVNQLVARAISSTAFRKCLATIVTRHECIIRNAKIINDCYGTALFIHMLATTFQLCFETFKVSTIIMDHLDISVLKMLFLLSYVIAIIMRLHIYCHTAERLMTESIGMAYGVYKCKWYELSASDARNLIFIVHRSNIPLRLTIGKFGIFSLQTFAMALKTAMGYTSALLTMKKEAEG